MRAPKYLFGYAEEYEVAKEDAMLNAFNYLKERGVHEKDVEVKICGEVKVGADNVKTKWAVMVEINFK